MLAPTRMLSEALERESCLYWRGRPVSVVRCSDAGGEVDGTRVDAMDMLSSAWERDDIVVVGDRIAVLRDTRSRNFFLLLTTVRASSHILH